MFNKKLFCIIILLIFSHCKKEKLNILKGNIFGTYYIIKYDNSVNNIKIQKGIDSIFYRINKSMNTYINDSDISKINKGDTTIIIDNLFKDVFNLSKEIHKKSNGYFDPTIGVLRNAYGFGGNEKQINNISNFQIDSLMRYVGFNKVKILKNGKIKKQSLQIYLDFNAIAKGYSVDKIVEYLSLNNIKNISVEIGGEIRVKGINTDKNKPWVVGIESKNSKIQDRKIRDAILLKNKAIAGSGNFRKFKIDPITKKKYVHTINPLTGKAEQNNIISAYVIANTCAETDAYATTFMAMDYKKSIELLKHLKNIEVYLVFYNEKGNIDTFITENFNKLIIK